ASPQIASVCEIVGKEIGRRPAEELIRAGAILAEHRVVDLGDALMFENVIEDGFFIAARIPANGFVQHHEEKAVERLREEQLEHSFRTCRHCRPHLLMCRYFDGPTALTCDPC